MCVGAGRPDNRAVNASTNAPLRVGVIGYGYWGPNVARNFAAVAGAEVGGVCDAREDRLTLARVHHPSARWTRDAEDLLADPSIDAVAITTPVATHHALTLAALQAGKHVLVEKPIAASTAEAREMVAAADLANRVLMVDHTFVYSGAVRRAKEIATSGELGDLYYFDSVRVNLGLFHHDASVTWDLAVHDLSIMQAWLPDHPVAVSCTGVAHVSGYPPDVAYLTIRYPGNVIAHVNVNWLSPVKVRRTILAGSAKTLIYDDLSADEKIKLYSRGVTLEENPVGTDLIPLAYRRAGDILIPQLDPAEPLGVMAAHFVECCRTGAQPDSGGEDALEVVAILEAADESMRQGGVSIPIDHASRGS